VLFQHVDHGLRELGVGDVAVPKRMKRIAQNFYGRVTASAEPLDQGDQAALAAALDRNIPGVASARLVPYLVASEGLLSALSLDDLLIAPTLFALPGQAEPAGPRPA
jgi:cytochrome b pre-mRNA-processing protein 3